MLTSSFVSDFDNPLLLFAFASIGLALAYTTIVKPGYNVFFHPLRKYPGPKLWAASQIPWLWTILGGKTHREIWKLHTKYGPVVRIGPNELSYAQPEAWESIMGHRKHGHVENLKDPNYISSSSHHIVGAGTQDHSRMRRLMSHGFSAGSMLQQQPLIQGYVDLLMQRLRENADDSKAPLDISAWFNYTTFDIIGDLAFGEPFGCLRESTLHPWVALIFSGIKIHKISQVFRNYPVLMPLLWFFVPSNLQQQARDSNQLSEERVSKRLALNKPRSDFIESMKSGKNEKFMTTEEVKANAVALIIAGSETTATVLSGAAFLLTTHPQVLSTLVKEVRSSFGKESDINLLNTAKLVYLSAVIEETLRIYPPTPNSQPRITSSESDTILGDKLPPKTVLNIPHWAMYHQANYFDRPMEFIPERWLKTAAGFSTDRKDCFQPFSYGPRVCIGKNLAYAEMRLILARLCWNFELRLSDLSRDWLDQKAYGVWQKPPLYVHLTPRDVAV
ncbi:cytochrome P450 [Xylariales sp. PMI_506]|nr:cytochrome P450 [Xylariales sp. PMI_506]